ncbi:AMP-binding protein [Salinadaptatus halalkaliphilus]|nr:AMP-binding protein [Salinadaptatus halalkaliphilus]
MVTTQPAQFPDEVPAEPTVPHGTRPLHEYLRRHAEETPRKPALIYYGTEISYGELNDAVDAFAGVLADRGYGKGDTLMLFLQNCPQYYVGYHAAHRLGMRVSPCSPMAKAHRVSYQLEDGDVDVVLALDAYADVLEDVRDESPLSDVVYTRLEAYLPDDPTPPIHEDMADATAVNRQPTDDSTLYFGQALEDAPAAYDEPSTAMDDVVLLQYTSGTTGQPKGCQHTYETILTKAASNAAVTGYGDDTRLLEVMPIFHVAGKLFAVDTPLIHGSTVVLLTRYSPDALLEAADAHEPTIGWLTTPMVRGVVDHPELEAYDLTSFERNPTTSFGQSLTEALCERWESITGGEMFEAAYGLSETHTMDTFTRGLGTVEDGFMGRPAHDVDIVVRDWQTHEELPRGEKGEISVASPSTMVGYLNKPDRTEDAFYGEYVLTGDVGKLTEDDCLYFLGRRKAMIKSSGYSVSPAEVEAILKEHEGIDNAAVVGRAHETRGEEVVAFVTLADDSLEADDILSWADSEMAAYKRPRDVTILESLPVTDVGKLDKQSLEQRA